MESVDSGLRVALRGLSLRQQVTAQNIANADTPGFRARTVTFEDRLQRALDDKISPDFGGTIDAITPSVQDAPGQFAKLDGNTVDMDQELVGMTDTSLRYNAVSRTLSDRLTLYRSVITDGKG